jgi:hypothetical protein
MRRIEYTDIIRPSVDCESLMVDARGLAVFLGIPPKKLPQLLSTDRLPLPCRLGLGRCRRWSVLELLEWVKAGCPRRAKWIESSFPVLHRILALRAFPCVVGRHPDCDHQLNCPFISRRHCGFSVRGGRVWVEDLGSRHGTRLNGQSVEGRRPLHYGDRLDLACLAFEVRLFAGSGPSQGS